MKEFFARLNPLERRFVVAVMVVIFLVINVLFVWPRFSDWNATKIRLRNTNKTLGDREKVIAQAKQLEPLIKQLEAASGGIVPLEDQSSEFQRTISSQAAESVVQIISSTTLRPTGATNAYFTEQIQSLLIQSGEAQLVDFLYKLGLGNSLIRVRDMSLNPDAPHYQLQANLKLVANFQKKTTLRTAAPATNAPAAKAVVPASPTPTKKKP